MDIHAIKFDAMLARVESHGRVFGEVRSRSDDRGYQICATLVRQEPQHQDAASQALCTLTASLFKCSCSGEADQLLVSTSVEYVCHEDQLGMYLLEMLDEGDLQELLASVLKSEPIALV